MKQPASRKSIDQESQAAAGAAGRQNRQAETHADGIAQRQVTDLAANHSGAVQQNALSERVNNSPQMLAQRKQMELMNGAAQRKAMTPQGNSQGVVQAKFVFEDGTGYLDNTKNTIPYSSFNRVQDKARKYYEGPADLTFKLGSSSGAAAFFTPDHSFFMGGSITVKPLSEQQITEKSYDYNDRLAEVAHETHHAIDHFEDLNLKTESFTEQVISEFRTFAVHSAVAMQVKGAGKNISSRFTSDAKSLDPDQQELADTSKNGFARGNRLFKMIQTYLTKYSGTPHDEDMTDAFIKKNQGEVDRAIAIYRSLVNETVGEHDTYNEQETYTTESEEEDLGDGVSMSTVTEHTRNVRKPVKG